MSSRWPSAGAVSVIILGVVSGIGALVPSGLRADQPQVAQQYEHVEGMILIPAGEFRFGSQVDDHFAEEDETPQRVMYLPAFYIDQFEVSNIEYKRFVDASGYPAPPSWLDGRYQEGADFYPVYEVSWWEAQAYAKWVGKRLPTEAEWEKAARGMDARRFPWGDDFDPDLANAGDGYVPVNALLAGASVYDVVNMSGNVAEWTASVYEPYPVIGIELPSEFGGASNVAAGSGETRAAPIKLGRAPEPDDPLLKFFKSDELRDSRDRVYRGGSINNFTQFLRVANRQHAGPRDRWYNIGFRCVKDAKPAQAKGN